MIRLVLVLDHFAGPFYRLLHLALQEMVCAQLVTQVLLRLSHLRRRVLDGIQRSDSGSVVLTLHQRIAQQLIDAVLVFRVRETAQEIIERAHGLTQRTGTLVRAEGVVITCLLGHFRCQLIAGCGLVRQLRLLRHMQFHIGVTHRQASRFGQYVFLLLDLFERFDSSVKLTQLILRTTEHVHIASQQLLFLLLGVLLVCAKMLHSSAVLFLRVVHLAYDSVQLAVIGTVGIFAKKVFGSRACLFVVALRIVNLRNVVRNGLVVRMVVLQLQQSR